MTPLDAICTAPFHEADQTIRARALLRLADTELFAALTAEPAADLAHLQIYDLPEGPVALACDAEDRLAGFVGGPVAYLALPGRVLAAALATEGRGLLVNPGHPSQMLLAPEVLGWLVRALAAEPSLAPDHAPHAMRGPDAQVAAALGAALAQRIGDLSDLVERAALVFADWGQGRGNHLLLLKGVAQDRRAAIAKAFGELLAFLPEVAGGVDIGFADGAFPADALVLEPPPPEPQPVTPKRDVNAPPRLR